MMLESMGELLLGLVVLVSIAVPLLGLGAFLIAASVNIKWPYRIIGVAAVISFFTSIYASVRLAGSYIPLDPECHFGGLMSASCAFAHGMATLIAERQGNIDLLMVTGPVAIACMALGYGLIRAHKANIARKTLGYQGIARL